MTGDRLKLLRKTIGLTQEQLAQRLGIGKAALSMIETGKAALSYTCQLCASVHLVMQITF